MSGVSVTESKGEPPGRDGPFPGSLAVRPRTMAEDPDDNG